MLISFSFGVASFACLGEVFKWFWIQYESDKGTDNSPHTITL